VLELTGLLARFHPDVHSIEKLIHISRQITVLALYTVFIITKSATFIVSIPAIIRAMNEMHDGLLRLNSSTLKLTVNYNWRFYQHNSKLTMLAPAMNLFKLKKAVLNAPKIWNGKEIVALHFFASLFYRCNSFVDDSRLL
jgi:hypothetical protein